MARTYRRLNSLNEFHVKYNVLKISDRRGWKVNSEISDMKNAKLYFDGTMKHKTTYYTDSSFINGLYWSANRMLKEESRERRRADWNRLKHKIAMNDNEYDIPENLKDHQEWSKINVWYIYT